MLEYEFEKPSDAFYENLAGLKDRTNKADKTVALHNDSTFNAAPRKIDSVDLPPTPGRDLDSYNLRQCTIISYDATQKSHVQMECGVCKCNATGTKQMFSDLGQLKLHMISVHKGHVLPDGEKVVKIDNGDFLEKIARKHCIARALSAQEVVDLLNDGGIPVIPYKADKSRAKEKKTKALEKKGLKPIAVGEDVVKGVVHDEAKTAQETEEGAGIPESTESISKTPNMIDLTSLPDDEKKQSPAPARHLEPEPQHPKAKPASKPKLQISFGESYKYDITGLNVPMIIDHLHACPAVVTLRGSESSYIMGCPSCAANASRDRQFFSTVFELFNHWRDCFEETFMEVRTEAGKKFDACIKERIPWSESVKIHTGERVVEMKCSRI